MKQFVEQNDVDGDPPAEYQHLIIRQTPQAKLQKLTSECFHPWRILKKIIM